MQSFLRKFLPVLQGEMGLSLNLQNKERTWDNLVLLFIDYRGLSIAKLLVSSLVLAGYFISKSEFIQE